MSWVESRECPNTPEQGQLSLILGDHVPTEPARKIGLKKVRREGAVDRSNLKLFHSLLLLYHFINKSIFTLLLIYHTLLSLFNFVCVLPSARNLFLLIFHLSTSFLLVESIVPANALTPTLHSTH